MHYKDIFDETLKMEVHACFYSANFSKLEGDGVHDKGKVEMEQFR